MSIKSGRNFLLFLVVHWVFFEIVISFVACYYYRIEYSFKFSPRFAGVPLGKEWPVFAPAVGVTAIVHTRSSTTNISKVLTRKSWSADELFFLNLRTSGCAIFARIACTNFLRILILSIIVLLETINWKMFVWKIRHNLFVIISKIFLIIILFL